MPLEALGNSAGKVIRRPFELQVLCALVGHVVVSLDTVTGYRWITVSYVSLSKVIGAQGESSAPFPGINSAPSCTNTACYQPTKLWPVRSIGRNTYYDFYYGYGAWVCCSIERLLRPYGSACLNMCAEASESRFRAP